MRAHLKNFGAYEPDADARRATLLYSDRAHHIQVAAGWAFFGACYVRPVGPMWERSEIETRNSLVSSDQAPVVVTMAGVPTYSAGVLVVSIISAVIVIACAVKRDFF